MTAEQRKTKEKTWPP